MQGLCGGRPEPAPLAGQALLLLCGAPRRSSPRQRGEGTGMRKCKCAAWRVPGCCWVREAAEGCDRKAKGVRGWHGDLAPRRGLTGEDLAGAAGDGGEVLDEVLAVGGFAAAAGAQQHDRLVLAAHQHAAVGGLGHRVDVRGRVLPAAPFEHVHDLAGRAGSGRGSAPCHPHQLHHLRGGTAPSRLSPPVPAPAARSPSRSTWRGSSGG